VTFEPQERPDCPKFRARPAFLVVQGLLALSDSEHLGAAYGTDTLSSRPAVLHGYGSGIPYFPLGTAFHTISLHSLPPVFL
jgi:hypothetical protein